MTLTLLTESDVSAIARELCMFSATNPLTTTLDIKTECRRRGFWATQSIVSSFVRSLCQSANPSLYVFSHTCTPYTSYQTLKWRDPSVIPPSQSWYIYAPKVSTNFMICDSSLTRSQARNLFAKTHSVAFGATRSRRNNSTAT